MKKYIFALPLFATALVACDPIQNEMPDPDPSTPASVMMDGLTFQQFADENFTTSAADGNYITYSTNPALPVQLYTLKSDGSKNILCSGPSGRFAIVPNRGQDPNQTIYVRLVNMDGSLTEGQTSINVFVPTELSTEMKFLASNDGEKIWKWDTQTTGVCWGNMGYQAGAGADFATSTPGQWWGVITPEELTGQLNHAVGGKATGDESVNAYMVFNESGETKVFDGNHNLIRTGSYEMQNYTGEYDGNNWKLGTLHTSEGAIMFPYEINAGGKYVTDYEVLYLSVDKMVLAYPDGGSQGAWGEATFWRFKSNSDFAGTMAGYGGGEKWGWDIATTGVCWGNMGYQAANAGDAFANETPGQWWGVTSEAEFLDQTAHSAGKVTGEESMDAYMLFKDDKTVAKFNGAGKKLAEGEWSFDWSTKNDFKLGTLNVSGGALLWPYEINSGGNVPDAYEILYMSADKMVLGYPDGGSQGAWGEATFWRFQKK